MGRWHYKSWRTLLVFFLLILGVLLVNSVEKLSSASTFTDTNQSDFDGGTYNQTFYNNTGGFVQLNVTNTSGSYTSKVFGDGTLNSWSNISWVQGAPYQQELPDNQSVETVPGGANMTGNVLLMHMNDQGGAIIDYSGEGNNGTQSGGVTYGADGKLGTALSFDGSGDYVEINNIPVNTAGGAHNTVEFWMYWNGGNSQMPIGWQQAYDLWLTSGYFGFNTGQGNVFGISSSGLANRWVHVAAIFYNGVPSSANNALYIDGVKQNIYACHGSTTASRSVTSTVHISGWARGGGYYFGGTIDEVAIYNRTLSSQEILDHYKRGALRLNVSVRSSDDPACSGESWIDINNTSPQNLSLSNNTYFQYKFDFETDNNSYPPELYNVTIKYDIVPTLDHYYVHTYQNGLPRSFFANNTQIQIRTNGTFYEIPTITITDSSNIIRVNEQNMTNQSGKYFFYNYTLNGSQGWYDVEINSQTWTDVFYQGELWQDNYTDADGNPFSFRREINVTEPGINKRWFEPIDIRVNFTYEPNSTSARVLQQYNVTDMLEIPSQLYNLNQTSGNLHSANVVFLSTINKSEIREYYVVTTKSDLPKTYTTDLTYSNASDQYRISNSYFTSFFNTSMGGLMQDAFDDIGTNTSLSGMEPIDYYPQFNIGFTPYYARSDTSVNVDTVAGPLLYRFNVSGQANDDSSKPYSLSYRIYSKNLYMICEKNQTTTADQNWKNLYINGLIFKDGSFTNVSYRNSTGAITTRALATGDNSDLTSLDTNMTWIAFYDTSLGNAVADLFLNKSFAVTSNPSISITDDSDCDYYQHLLIDSTPTSVSSGQSFYTKTARMIYNGLQEYSIVNETYGNLLHPLRIRQGNEETFDSAKPVYSPAGNISSNDQNNATCYSYWTDDSFLDHAVINITGPGENGSTTVLYQNTSYTIRSAGSFTNKSWVNMTLNASDINAGQINCNISVYDVAGNSNWTLIQFNVSDKTPPCFNSVVNEPNTNAGLDPNIKVNITVNITEYTNLSAVILQYRNSSQQEWRNISMNKTWNSSYKYNYSANFTPATEDVWQYRVFANDSEGNSYTINITNLSVYYDWTWECSPSTFGPVSGLLGTSITLGNITINNTGDKPLSFKITSNLDNKNQIFFNDTAEGYSGFSFNLSSESSINISVNGTAKSTERSDDLTITISALNTSASPEYNTTTATIVSYASGPFLLLTITEYPPSITQGNTGVALNVQVQNKGNETATNAWLTWNLPSGWTVTSGSLNSTIGDLDVDDIGDNQITVSISSSAPTGTKTLTARAGCSENKTGSDSVSTVVVEKSGGGNGGSSGGYTPGEVAEMIIETTLRGEKTLSSLETFEIVRGYNDSFPVTVKNTLYENATLYNVSMSVTGYLSQYLQVSPEIIDEIQYDESKQFNVTITSPAYMKKGTYQLNITITGKIVGHLLEMNLTDTRFVTLVIHEVSMNDANTSMIGAAGLIDDMANAGFQITKANRILYDAQQAFSDHDYEKTKKLCEEIKTIKENAFSANDLIQQTKNSIENGASSRSLDKTQTILNLAIAAFEREDYKTAFMRARDALTSSELESKEFDLAVFLSNYWWAILGGIILAILAGILLYHKVMTATITQKIRNLGREEDNIRKLMVEAQKNRFEYKKLSAEEYQRVMARHQKRLIEIKGLMTKLRHKRVRLLKTGAVLNDLDRENVEIVDLIKGVQEKYFRKHVITKSDYTDQIRSYDERLAEIEGERLTLEMMLAKGEDKR